MLSEEVCKKCKRSHYGTRAGCGWSERSGELWDNGFTISCPAAPKGVCVGKIRARDKKPPEKCPYKLEHAMAAGMKNNE